MTLTANPAAATRTATRNTGYGMMTTPKAALTGLAAQPQMAKRTYEVAALREDTSLYIGQNTAPAIPLFENAFSAFTHGSLIQTTMGLVAVEDL